jgi:large subunit ribosomal protein L28
MTKRRWLPNLQKIKIELDGKVKAQYVCAACIRTGKIRKVV